MDILWDAFSSGYSGSWILSRNHFLSDPVVSFPISFNSNRLVCFGYCFLRSYWKPNLGLDYGYVIWIDGFEWLAVAIPCGGNTLYSCRHLGYLLSEQRYSGSEMAQRRRKSTSYKEP